MILPLIMEISLNLPNSLEKLLESPSIGFAIPFGFYASKKAIELEKWIQD